MLKCHKLTILAFHKQPMFSPGVFRDMALLGLCLELSFSNQCYAHN